MSRNTRTSVRKSRLLAVACRRPIIESRDSPNRSAMAAASSSLIDTVSAFDLGHGRAVHVVNSFGRQHLRDVSLRPPPLAYVHAQPVSEIDQ